MKKGQGLPRACGVWIVLCAVSLAGACSLDRQGAGVDQPGGQGGEPDGGQDVSVGGAGQGGAGGQGGAAGKAGKGGAAGTAGTGGMAGEGGSLPVGGSGGAAGASGQAGAAGAPLLTCPTAGGPAMVPFAAGFCIDSTEVTRAQYKTWLDTTPSTSGQPAECAWNDSFAPLGPACQDHPKNVCQGNLCSDHPQVCIDWCDAYAYCKAVGKRLCGKLGGQPLPTPMASFDDPSADQWMHACSSNGANTWTFGNTAPAPPYPCNFGHNSDTYSTVAVQSLTTCQSNVTAFQGVFDLDGNAAEWQDSCAASTGKADPCRLRGGEYDLGVSSNQCDRDQTDTRDTRAFYTGFRCCFP